MLVREGDNAESGQIEVGRYTNDSEYIRRLIRRLARCPPCDVFRAFAPGWRGSVAIRLATAAFNFRYATAST